MRDLIIAVILVLTAPLWLILLIIKPHWRAGLGQRFIGPEENVDLWLHGASMGESLAAARLLEELQDRKHQVVMSVMTLTARDVMNKALPDWLDHIELVSRRGGSERVWNSPIAPDRQS